MKLDGKRQSAHLVHALVTDFGGVTRGRGFPLKYLESHLTKGVGWVPINQTISPFDDIPYPGQWGPVGDCRLMPDPATEFRFDGDEGEPPLHFLLSDIVALDGSPDDVCTRSFLKSAIEKLKETTRLQMIAAFEHEFVLEGEVGDYSGFSLQKARAEAAFGHALINAMEQNDLKPETFLPEFAANQFEITNKPFDALQAADNAVIVRELVKDLASSSGRKASFSPKYTPEGLGSGVHIHFSLQETDGTPVTYDAANTGGLSDCAASFAAGVLEHLPALCAFLTPGVVSYQRLQPHSWSAAFTCLGDGNREAALRIAPTFADSEQDRAKQYNLELRVADACANPYLALGMVILAGLDGMGRKLPAPPIVNADPEDLSGEECQRLGINRLPTSLDAALKAFEANKTVRSWLNNTMCTGYLDMKALEIDRFKDLSDEDVCRAYRSRF